MDMYLCIYVGATPANNNNEFRDILGTYSVKNMPIPLLSQHLNSRRIPYIKLWIYLPCITLTSFFLHLESHRLLHFSQILHCLLNKFKMLYFISSILLFQFSTLLTRIFIRDLTLQLISLGWNYGFGCCATYLIFSLSYII